MSNNSWKRTKARKAFADKAEVKRFVEELVSHWDNQGYSHEEVHERATRMMADAVNGVEFINDKPVYARALGSLLKDEGCFMDEAKVSTVQKDNPYF